MGTLLWPALPDQTSWLPAISRAAYLWTGTVLFRLLIMIGIQEDVLNMFLISHFMILFSVGGLIFAFTLLLCLKMNSNTSFSLPRSGGWFGGQPRRVEQRPVFVEEPRQRRAWWQRN